MCYNREGHGNRRLTRLAKPFHDHGDFKCGPVEPHRAASPRLPHPAKASWNIPSVIMRGHFCRSLSIPTPVRSILYHWNIPSLLIEGHTRAIPHPVTPLPPEASRPAGAQSVALSRGRRHAFTWFSLRPPCVPAWRATPPSPPPAPKPIFTASSPSGIFLT